MVDELYLGEEDFVQRFGGVYEHSHWIARASWHARLAVDNPAQLSAVFARVVDEASRAEQLRLICAHPELAGRLAVNGELTAESTAEQSSAGLDCCSEQEFAQIETLNKAYAIKFKFPFVMAVKGYNRRDIISAFGGRLQNSYTDEFATAIKEIHKIARIRLEQLC